MNGTSPMMIVYRMRGLLGDATEEFVESLQDDNLDVDVKKYRFALYFGEIDNGLSTLVERFL